jgi:hypothetical protein
VGGCVSCPKKSWPPPCEASKRACNVARLNPKTNFPERRNTNKQTHLDSGASWSGSCSHHPLGGRNPPLCAIIPLDPRRNRNVWPWQSKKEGVVMADCLREAADSRLSIVGLLVGDGSKRKRLLPCDETAPRKLLHCRARLNWGGSSAAFEVVLPELSGTSAAGGRSSGPQLDAVGNYNISRRLGRHGVWDLRSSAGKSFLSLTTLSPRENGGKYYFYLSRYDNFLVVLRPTQYSSSVSP